MSPMGNGTLSRAHRRGRRTLRPLGLASVGLGLLLVALSMVTGSAHASTLDGAAVITDGSTNTVITTPQASTQLFTIVLPSMAACDADTATGGYHVYSYVINGPLSSAALTTYLQGLNPNNDFPTKYLQLTDNGGNFYAAQNTAIGTGQVVSIPLNFDFGVLNSDLSNFGMPTLAGTTQEVGLLCATADNIVKDYWNQEVTFTASGTDPGGFTWTPGVSGVGSGTTTTTTAPGGGSTTSTSTPDSSTTDTTSTTVDQSTTSTTTSSDTGTTSTTAATFGDSGGQSSGGSTGDPSSSSGTGAQLAATGSSIRPELNVGVLFIAVGALLLVCLPSRRTAQVPVERHDR